MRVLSLMIKAKIKLIIYQLDLIYVIFTSFDGIFYSSHPILFFSFLHFLLFLQAGALGVENKQIFIMTNTSAINYIEWPRLLHDVFGHF